MRPGDPDLGGVRLPNHKGGIRKPDELPDPAQLSLQAIYPGLDRVGGKAKLTHRVPELLVLLDEGVSLGIQKLQATRGGALQGRQRPHRPLWEGRVAIPEAHRKTRVCRIDPEFGVGPVVQGGGIESLRRQGIFQGSVGQVQEALRHEGGRIRVGRRIPRVQSQKGEKKEGPPTLGTRLASGSRIPEGQLRTAEVSIR